MEYITQEELVTLNEARDALTAISKRLWPGRSTLDAVDGMIYALAATAQDAIFTVLNWTNAYGHQDIPDDVMHNRKVTANVG